jgi:hypothetical protein
MYNTGILLTFVYLYYEGAVVGYVCILVELVLGMFTTTTKVYLDRKAAGKRAAAGGKLAAAPSFQSEVRADLREFLAGGAAPFPLLMTPEESHAAQHLLVDIHLPQNCRSRGNWQKFEKDDVLGKGLSVAEEGATESETLQVVASLLSSALADANVLAEAPRMRVLPSFRSKDGGLDDGGAGTAPEAVFATCRDGIATCLLSEDGALTVDFLASSDEATRLMGKAARRFCEAAVVRFPGAMISTCRVQRSPVR